jgi:anti-anti-sigma factor
MGGLVTLPVRGGSSGGAHDDVQEPAPVDVSCRVEAGGEVVVDLAGELDIVSAEAAVSYVRNVVDRPCNLVVVDLTALTFCDAQGLAALLRMASYAERAGCEFRLASPRPSLVKIMRITGLDRKFLGSQQTCPTAS